MPLYDSSNRITSDACYLKLKASDNRRLATYNLVTSRKNKIYKPSGDTNYDDGDKQFIDFYDEYDIDGECKCDDYVDEQVNVENNDPYDHALKHNNLNIWDGYGTGPRLLDDFFGDDNHNDQTNESLCEEHPDLKQVSPSQRPKYRLFTASPYLGMHVPHTNAIVCDDDLGNRLGMISTRRGGGESLISKYEIDGSGSGSVFLKPQSNIQSSQKPSRSFCNTYLQHVSLDNEPKNSRKKMRDADPCLEMSNSNRIVDRLAEREWNRFDPVILEKSLNNESIINATFPREWVAGGASSRDIARSSTFMQTMGYELNDNSKNLWKRPD